MIYLGTVTIKNVAKREFKKREFKTFKFLERHGYRICYEESKFRII